MSDEPQSLNKWKGVMLMRSLPILEPGKFEKKTFIFLNRLTKKRSFVAIGMVQENLRMGERLRESNVDLINLKKNVTPQMLFASEDPNFSEAPQTAAPFQTSYVKKYRGIGGCFKLCAVFIMGILVGSVITLSGVITFGPSFDVWLKNLACDSYASPAAIQLTDTKTDESSFVEQTEKIANFRRRRDLEAYEGKRVTVNFLEPAKVSAISFYKKDSLLHAKTLDKFSSTISPADVISEENEENGNFAILAYAALISAIFYGAIFICKLGLLIANRYISGFPRRLPISEPVIVRPSVAASKLDAYDYEMDSSV
ncbi:unnamed protein product [Oikopleura dioica]|uniref:Uncharacterized protein n=1 Tax=Oikopleura dioica TaxID=34765 RepID=E4XEW9_OIKDI|nr:unnamed protein product [Oikopleura dioica]